MPPSRTFRSFSTPGIRWPFASRWKIQRPLKALSNARSCESSRPALLRPRKRSMPGATISWRRCARGERASASPSPILPPASFAVRSSPKKQKFWTRSGAFSQANYCSQRAIRVCASASTESIRGFISPPCPISSSRVWPKES